MYGVAYVYEDFSQALDLFDDRKICKTSYIIVAAQKY